MFKGLRRWFVQHIELVSVILMALLASLPLFLQSGLLATRSGGDSPFLLQRTQQLVVNLEAGVFPARWMPDGAYGYGYPFFDFYASLPYYLAALLDMAGLGTLLGIKVTQAAGMFLAALGSYWLARELSSRRGVGVAVSAAYTLAPVHLVNIYVRGDALGEFFAMAWFPLIILGIYRLRRLRSSSALAFLAFSFGALILSHNISALIFAPLAILFLFLATLDRHITARWRFFAMGMAALGLGLLLSLWFWLPALHEQSLVQLQEQTTGYFNYAGHFRWLNLIQGRLVFDYTIDADRNPFQMGMVQALLLAAGILALAIQLLRRQHLSSWQIGALIALLAYTFLITPWSKAVWDHLPLLPMVQFPWRMFSVQALLIALLYLNLWELLPTRLGTWLVVPSTALVLASALLGLKPTYIPLANSEITNSRFMLYEIYSGNIGTTVRAEYLPRWTVPRPYVSGEALGLPVKPLALEGVYQQAELLHEAPNEQTWQVRTERSLLAFPTSFYPGWEAEVDGVHQGVEPLDGLGQLGLRLEPGGHTVRLYFTPTGSRLVTRRISLAALVIWLILLSYDVYRHGSWRRAMLVLGCLLAFAAWTLYIPHITLTHPEPSGPRVQDFGWAPLLHHEPQGIFFGAAHLLDYSFGQDELTPGGSLRIKLKWAVPKPDITFSVQLVAATAHLMEPAPIWAQMEVPVGTGEIELPLPSELPPGLYVLRFGANQGSTALVPTNGQGVELSLLASSPLRVTAAPAAEQGAAAGTFGPVGKPAVISLLGARILPSNDGALLVELRWRSEAQAPLNYYLSLRLKSSDGKQITSRDLPPFAGTWPTTLWRPGELYTDRVVLPLQSSLADQLYALEVVLYDRQSLQAVGTVVIPEMVPF